MPTTLIALTADSPAARGQRRRQSMQIARGSRGIEPVCLRNGPKLALSLAAPELQPLLRRVCDTFWFLSTYELMHSSPESYPGGLPLVLLRRDYVRLAFDAGHFLKDMFDSDFNGFRQARPELLLDAGLRPSC